METSNSLTYFMPGGAPRAGIDRVPYDAELDRLECLAEEARLRDRCSSSDQRSAHRPARRASYDSVADRLAEGADVSFLTEQGYLNY